MEQETQAIRARILVVDDTPATLVALCELLVEEYEVLFATSGQEALEMAQANPPDLILLDVVMPGMDGYAVCTGLKSDPRTSDIPVIFITSMGEEPDQARGFEAGAIDYVQKPISPALVKARVRNHLGQKRRQDSLKGLMMRDGLTGIANRRRFDESLREEWARGIRNGSMLSLIMIDLDHFKRYNDTYGHAAGDACLKSVAGALQAALQRPVDLAARYGGEEFVCLLPETDAAGALQIAQRIQQRVADLALPHRDSPTRPVVTLSLGTASCTPDVDGRPDALLVEADNALYRAKNGGRDRVVQSKPAAALGTEGGEAPPILLLVEDDKHMRTLLAARLGFLPVQVEVVPSAQEALAFLARGRAHLILSDVVMPGMDGFALCQRIKEDPARRDIPFVLLTSLTRDLRERSAQAGADDHLSKLEDDRVFRMRIRTLLELGTLLAAEPGPAPTNGTASALLLTPSATVRAQLTTHLQPLGIQVQAHDHLDGLLGGAGARMPDLLLMDLDPAAGDPVAAVRAFRDLRGGDRVPCLALAQKGEEPLLAPLEAQIQDRLQKPLDAQDVRHRAGLLLRLARVRRRTG